MIALFRFFREPDRDPALGAALLRVEQPVDDHAAENLRIQILASARHRLAEVRTSGGDWWDCIGSWTPIAVPAGLAVCAVALLVLPSRADLVGTTASTAQMHPDSVLVAAVLSPASVANDAAAQLIAVPSGDWLVSEASSR